MSAPVAPFHPSRRLVMASLAAVATVGWDVPGHAGTAERHGLSAFGDLKYGPDFQNLGYADPSAPRGGRLSSNGPGLTRYNQNDFTFDSLNSFILMGRAPANLDQLCFDSLMARAYDEPDAVYGLIARSVEVSDDRLTYAFNLRPEARFQDGTPVTAEDVVFSLTTLRDKGHPQISETIKPLEAVTAEGKTRVVLHFAKGSSRSLPLFVVTLPILSKAWYATRDFEATTLDRPLGSGPYRVGHFEVGRFIEFERVKDYWAKDLPIRRGTHNFDVIRYDMYRDRTVAFEAFKAGQYLQREEFTARTWMTEYNFPAAQDGRIVKLVLPDGQPSGLQGWFFNTRRAQFRDPRVRQAIGLAFDFEWTNKTLFYDAYKRTQSYFENSDLRAEGMPSPEELALLEPFRGKVPESVFGPAVSPDVTDGSGRDRAPLRKAADLLAKSGWTSKNGSLQNAAGERLQIEFLQEEPTFERILGPYVQNLKLLGIDATIRTIDASQFQSRVNDFDFDLIPRRFSQSPTPDDSIRDLFSASRANLKGSQNYAGINDPVVDQLIDRLLGAPTRHEMAIAGRALDRVLRASFYIVPHWFLPAHRIAAWDVYGRPATPALYDRQLEATWWVDPAKATKSGKGM